MGRHLEYRISQAQNKMRTSRARANASTGTGRRIRKNATNVSLSLYVNESFCPHQFRARFWCNIHTLYTHYYDLAILRSLMGTKKLQLSCNVEWIPWIDSDDPAHIRGASAYSVSPTSHHSWTVEGFDNVTAFLLQSRCATRSGSLFLVLLRIVSAVIPQVILTVIVVGNLGVGLIDLTSSLPVPVSSTE